jgi:Bacterial extracellular solute-binding proteins, family 3.
MVIEDKGALRGFSIDLWNSISARLNRETEYLVMSDVGELLDAVGTVGLISALRLFRSLPNAKAGSTSPSRS